MQFRAIDLRFEFQGVKRTGVLVCSVDKFGFNASDI
jgi:hypothetical protein